MPNYKFQEKLIEQRKNPETARAGLKWSHEEDITLIDNVRDNISFDEIAKKLQRTPGSIKTRLIIKAISYLNENSDKTEEEVAIDFGIEATDIEEYLKNKKIKDQKNQKYRQQQSTYQPRSYYNNSSNAMVTLSTIHSLLLEINNKLG